MKTFATILIMATASGFASAAAQSQEAKQALLDELMKRGDSTTVVVDANGMILSGGAPVTVGAEGEAAATGPTPRQQALSALIYDRRASAILKAWATKEEEKPEPEEDDAAADEGAVGEGVGAGAPETSSEGGGSAEGASEGSGGTPEEPAVDPAGGGTVVPSSGGAAAATPPVSGTATVTGTLSTPPVASGAAIPAVTLRAAQPASGAAPAAGPTGLDPAGTVSPEDEAAQAAAAAAAQEQAAAVAAASAEAAKLQAYEAKVIAWEGKVLQRRVSIGDWPYVGDYFRGLSEEESQAGYQAMLSSLVKGPPPPNTPLRNYAEKNQFSADDIFGLAAASPKKLDDAQMAQLGQILVMAITQGHLLEEIVDRLKEGVKDEDFPLGRRQVAKLLFGAGSPIEAGDFLPDLDKAVERDDRDGLNLVARHLVARYAKDRDIALLERAWKATQAVLADGELSEEAKDEALARSVELAPKLRDELGQAWLNESFTERPQRGMEVLAAIGGAASTGMQTKGRGSDERQKTLSIQTTAANALIEAAPELAAQWRDTLVVLASVWLREADYSRQYDTSTTRGPQMQRDVYGNYFYYNYNRVNRTNMPEPIPTGDVLKLRPSDRWLQMLDDAQRPKFAMLVAQLLLKIGEEEEAFPHIEALARSHPDRAEDLVQEFLRVWIENHDPNSSRNRTDIYMFSYGYNQRASGIPLTRSKQERNLRELAGWVQRLRALPLDDLDEKLLARAFVASHSAAEVYQLDAVERVFGSMASVGPDTLAELIQTMRANLATVWRLPATQEDAKTRRKQKDVQLEVRRGYDTCKSLCQQGLSAHPEHWGLMLAQGAVMHDENDFLHELSKSAEYMQRRGEALALLEGATRAYAAQVSELDEDDRSARCFDTWFYAALGAADLGGIDHEKQMVPGEIAKIRQALHDLPGDAADEHLGYFANSLFTRMSSVNPAVKFRYVRQGLEIVGDDERADEARKVFQYYRDLVTEIQLVTRIDGSDRVGTEEPFGLFIDIRHTTEIERESGGFGKYLTNQNNQRYAFNYGRPLEDYRDKFEEAARALLAEHFDVQSITFNKPETHSKSDPEPGWRVTPYAYVLLKPRGPEIDRVPALKLDLDFLDTSGYAVIPVESAPLAIDAASAQPRPYAELAVTQTLDERQAEEGKLMLEIKARAAGIVPPLEELLDLRPEGFELASVEDQGVSVAEFDDDSDQTRVVSERLWMVELRGKEGLAELPAEFEFGKSRDVGAEIEYMRYVDADLESVSRRVSLEQEYGEVAASSTWPWWLGGGLLVALAIFFATRGGGRELPVEQRLHLPEEMTPFTVIGYLREIDRRNHLTKDDRNDLIGEITRIEKHFYLGDGSAAPDLTKIAHGWARKVG